MGPDVVNPAGLFRSPVSAEIHKKFLWDGSQCASGRCSPKEGEQGHCPSLAAEADQLCSEPTLALLSSVTWWVYQPLCASASSSVKWGQEHDLPHGAVGRTASGNTGKTH